MTKAKAVVNNNLNRIRTTLPVYVIYLYVPQTLGCLLLFRKYDYSFSYEHMYDFEEDEMFLFVATKANSALKV